MRPQSNPETEFRQKLEQAYWDRRLAILKLNMGIKVKGLDASQAHIELILLESFRSWIQTGRNFNTESAKRILENMKKVKVS